MAVIKLRAGQTVLVAAVDPNLVIGGGPMPGGPDLGLGIPTHPIVLPPDPTQPLPPVDPGYNPPGVGPGTPGTRPPPGGVDPGFGNPWFDPHPAHPIVLPPPGEIPPPIDPPTTPTLGWDLKVAWTPVTGWVVVAVPGEGSLVPTPSRKK